MCQAFLARLLRLAREFGATLSRHPAEERVRLSWTRRPLGEVVLLRIRVEAPRARAGAAVAEATARLAGTLAAVGLNVGGVGAVSGEEPVLVALAPRADLLAPWIRQSLGGGAAHRRRQLWLTLAPGTFLASVVDPYRPFDGDPEGVAAIVAGGRVRYAFATRLDPGRSVVRIEIEAYGRRADLRELLRTARRDLSG